MCANEPALGAPQRWPLGISSPHADGLSDAIGAPAAAHARSQALAVLRKSARSAASTEFALINRLRVLAQCVNSWRFGVAAGALAQQQEAEVCEMLIAIWNSTVSGLLDDRMAAAGHSLLGDITAVFDANLAGEHDDAI